MFEIPEACPTWSRGTAAVEPDEAGPLATPRPTASATSGPTNAAHVHEASTNASTAKPTAARPKPSATAAPPPIRPASGVISGVIAIMPAAAGSVASPASNALMPNAAGSWKYRLSTYMSALIVPATIRIASVAPTSTLLRSRLRFTSGAFARRSTTTNSPAAAIATAMQPSVAAEAQPQSLPSLSARMSGPSTSAISTVPTKSIERGAFGSLDSATVASVSGTHAAAMAASIQNKPCQPVVSTSTPPSSGPSAPPAADAAPHSVIAFICAEPDEATDSRLMPQARIVAPDAPWIMRPATTPVPLVESAMNAHEATNSSRPAMNTLRRPSTSPSAPEVTMTAAPTSE